MGKKKKSSKGSKSSRSSKSNQNQKVQTVWWELIDSHATLLRLPSGLEPGRRSIAVDHARLDWESEIWQKFVGLSSLWLWRAGVFAAVLLWLVLSISGVEWYFGSEVQSLKLEALKNPQSEEVYVELARVAASSGDYERAIELLASASVSSEEARSKVLGAYDTVYGLVDPVGFLQEKVEYWQGVLEKQPSYVPAMVRISLYSWQLRDDEGAREYLQRAREVDPNNPLLDKLGEVVE